MIRASISKIKIGTEVRDIHAIQLTNERKITLDGAVTGTGYFDGSGDLTITTSTNHTHNYAGSSSAGGAANSANKLTTARTIQTNLSSTAAASFDGSANITPGVMGVLPVANGGTGVSGHTVNRLVWSTSATQIQAAYHYANNTKVAINSTSEPSTNFYVNGTSAFRGDITIQTDDTDKFINFANGDGFGWRIGYLGTGAGDANYLAVQSDGPSAGTYSNALRFGLTTLDAAFGGNVYPLVNNTKTLGTSSLKWSNVYATTFTGALNGNASSASKVNNSLIIKLNGGSTEGTNLFTFNGSTAKTINITAAAIGASASGHKHTVTYKKASTATGNATATGTISAPTFTGTAHKHTFTGSSHNHTLTPTTATIKQVNSVGTMFKAEVSGEVLILTPGSAPTTANVTVYTGLTIAAATQGGTIANTTATGTVSAPTFTGTAHSHTITLTDTTVTSSGA